MIVFSIENSHVELVTDLQIADFGVSEQVEENETNTLRWAGTPAFLAPETLCKYGSHCPTCGFCLFKEFLI